MKTVTNGLKTILLVALMSLCFTSCKKEKKETEEVKTETTYSSIPEVETPCLSETSWFPHSQTPAPSEGKGSPFDVSETTNCIFHQWSWQKFLWVTKPEGDLPLFLDQSQILQVTSSMAKVAQQEGANVV